jgi:tetratricopeptide (TPR) repeat protein
MAPILSLSLLLAALQAPGSQEPAATTFELKTRETLTGRVLGMEDEWVLLSVQLMGGSTTVRRRIGDFAPESELRIRRQIAPPATFEEQLGMAKTAVRLGLLPQAGIHAGFARALAAADASGAQGKALDVWAAGTLGTLFANALKQGQLVEARHYLRLIATRVAEQFSEDEIGNCSTSSSRPRSPAAKQRAPPSSAARHTELDKLWAPILGHLQAGDVLVKAGLRASRSTTQATRSYERAIAAYTTAGHELDAAMKKLGKDQLAESEAALLYQRIKDSAAQAALHAGHAATVQGDYRSALAWANTVLQIDAGNADAKALLQTIEIAQAAGGGWGRGWGR